MCLAAYSYHNYCTYYVLYIKNITVVTICSIGGNTTVLSKNDIIVTNSEIKVKIVENS